MPLLRAVEEALPPEFELRPTRQPMLWEALAYGAGIAAGPHLHLGAWWVVVALAFLLVVGSLVSLLSQITFAAATLAVSSFFFAGALNIELRGVTGVIDTTLLPLDGQSVELIAHVRHEGSWRDAGPGEMRETGGGASGEIVVADGG